MLTCGKAKAKPEVDGAGGAGAFVGEMTVATPRLITTDVFKGAFVPVLSDSEPAESPDDSNRGRCKASKGGIGRKVTRGAGFDRET